MKIVSGKKQKIFGYEVLYQFKDSVLGYRLPSNQDGCVLVNDLNTSEKASWRFVTTNLDLFEQPILASTVKTILTPSIMYCDCKHAMEMSYNPNDVYTCICGKTYNTNGKLIAKSTSQF